MNHFTHPLASRTLLVVVTMFVLDAGGPEVLGQRQAETLRALDKNGDRAISKEEAGETLWKRLSRRDANGDGKLTETFGEEVTIEGSFTGVLETDLR